MPLTEARAAALRDRVQGRHPPTTFEAVGVMGGTETLLGYMDETRGPLDALGMFDYEARLHLDPDQPVVNPGDLIADRWVAWSPEWTTAAWRIVNLRRLPTFEAWDRERRVSAGRDPDTRAPLFTTEIVAIDAYLHRAARAGEIDGGEVGDRTTGTLIVPATIAVLEIADVLVHATHGRYHVTARGPYGPWTEARVEAI